MKKIPWITLQRVREGGGEIISIRFYYNAAVVAHLKSLNIARYHREGKYWYTVSEGFDHKAFAESMRPVAMVNYRALKPGWKPSKRSRPNGLQDPFPAGSTWGPLTVEHVALTDRFRQWLPQHHGDGTLPELSVHWFSDLLSYIQPDRAYEAKRSDILEYVQEHIVGGRLSVLEQQQVVMTIMRFFREELQQSQSHFPVRHIKQGGKSVAVLTRQEVIALFKAPMPDPHRCMLALIYLFGLRTKALQEISTVDLNPGHRTLRINQPKGGGSKVLPIPDQLAGWLEQYLLEHKTYLWLFEGREPGSQYPPSTLQGALKKALIHCGITRKITLTGLRRSYAVHLMEEGAAHRKSHPSDKIKSETA